MLENFSYTDELLDRMRLTTDQDADQFISYIFSDEARKISLQHWMSNPSSPATLTQFQHSYPQYAFLQDAAKLPEWADQKLMVGGAAFFAKHATQIMTLLGLLSLPYCYAAAKGAMVLYLSEMMRNNTGKRLSDTAFFVWEVMNPNAFTTNGNGFQEILKVRLRHAAARYYTLKSGRWDNQLGAPINQEDMAGTNLSFSLIVIRGLRKLGVTIMNQEQTAFIHLWLVIGYKLGMHQDIIPSNIKSVQNLEQAIRRRQFQASMQGEALTTSLTDYIQVAQADKANKPEILGLMRHLLGNEVSDMLGIKSFPFPNFKLAMLELSSAVSNLGSGASVMQRYRAAYLDFKRQNKMSDI